LKEFPITPIPYSRNDLERAIDGFGEDGLAEYLRSKGFRVTKSIKNVSDKEIIRYLETKGYIIQGLLDGYYYDSKEKLEDIPFSLVDPE
jgi:hypothetical protein